MISELTKEIVSLLKSKEDRVRTRTEIEQVHFTYSVRHILTELWKASHCMPPSEASINRRSGYYSENKRYISANLTYRQTIAAFKGLLDVHLIEITQEGYYDRNRHEGSLTRFIARPELQERLNELEGHPAIILRPDLDQETIILRDKHDGKREVIDYEDTDKTITYRNNLKSINQCFARHWADLKIKDLEIEPLSERLLRDKNKNPIDLSQRILFRIFSNGSFKEGGRFYRAWWQNVPSEYRKFITLDGKTTTEYDFSQLNPNMIYDRYNLELGSEDAYNRVLDGEHRDIVKQAFNAMIQAKTQLQGKPTDLDLDTIGMDWKDLRERILQTHKPIAHLFFSGLGNKLQFEDSAIAENIILQFVEWDAPALPVHDSFIMHHGYGSDLEEAMRRAYYERFGNDIPVKQEVMFERERTNDDPPKSLDIQEILDGEVEYSLWQDRDRFWWKEKSQKSTGSK